MKVLYIANIPSPYRVEYFNELGKYCDLTVLFEKSSSDERSDLWKNYKFDNFKGIIMKGKKIATDSAFCPSVVKYVDKSYDAIVCCDFLSPTGMVLVNYMKLKKIPYWLESDGGFAGRGTGLRERIKKNIIPGAQGYFSTSSEHDNYYITYGADPEKVHRYPFTSLRKSDILTSLPTRQEKDKIKTELNINEKIVFLTVGQFIYRKGYDLLLNALKGIDLSDVGIYIVGGKVTQEYKDLCQKNDLKNVHFLDFMKSEDLAQYYRASDIFVMPTREDIWGLVVNEAMAYGLPVISSDRCIAANELVHNGENGFLFKSEDIEDLKDRILYMLNHPESYEKFGENSLKIISKYSFSGMVESHLDTFKNHIGEAK